MLLKGAQRAEGPQKAGEGLLEVTAGFGQTEHRRTDPFQAGDTTGAKRKRGQSLWRGPGYLRSGKLLKEPNMTPSRKVSYKGSGV